MFKPLHLALAAAFAVEALAPSIAIAQHAGTAVERRDNARATTDLRARIAATDARVTEAQRSRAITRARATALRDRIAQVRRSETRLSRQQGFASAAELASYNRTLGAIDVELDRRGVARSYGNDMLVTPKHR